jgi:large subunit ribosomal protein L25
MPDISLAVEPREELGTRPTRRLRATGRIPAVVYGHGDEPVAVSVDARELRAALSTQAGDNALFDIVLNGTPHLAIARALQRNAIRSTIAHIDFQVVSRDELVTADVRINLIGDAIEVHRGGGTLEQALFSLHIHAKPGDIPPSIDIDISELHIGDHVRLADLKLPEGVTADADPESTILVAQAPRTGEGGESAEPAQAPSAGPAESGESENDAH